jgi:hypothetical protein
VGALLTKGSQIQALNLTQKVSPVPIPTPGDGSELHLLIDNFATQSGSGQKLAGRKPPDSRPFSQTSGSWLNLAQGLVRNHARPCAAAPFPRSAS